MADIPAIFADKLSPRGREAIDKTREFVIDYCIPASKIYHSQIKTDPAQRWKYVPPVMEQLKAKAKLLGLWNMFLLKHYAEGGGFSNLEYGLMAQYLGMSFVAPEATNTSAPDTGNMEILARYGLPLQKARWLQPLLDGHIRLAFLMTEKGVLLLNALNILCLARVQGDKVVLDGVKWFALGAGDPRCKVWLVMCKTDNGAQQYRNHLVLVIDADKAVALGRAEVVRPLHVFGYDDAPHGHCEVRFLGLEVPFEKDTVLGSLGQGFEIIQLRLGPGRIHHCMRSLGVAEYALLIVAHRANNRLIFGEPLRNRELFQTAYAQFKIDIERCRLLVLNAAHKIDIAGPKAAKREIAVAKIETPRTTLAVLDWCIQMFGAEGVSQDTELAYMYAMLRTLRMADGPDEAHLGQLAKGHARHYDEASKFFAKVEADRAKIAGLAKL